MPEKEEYIEIDYSQPETEKLFVRVESLNNYKDVDKIIEHVRNNKLVFVRIKDIKKKSEAELKKSIEKIKKFIESVEGDIVGVGDDLLVVAPRTVRILK